MRAVINRLKFMQEGNEGIGVHGARNDVKMEVAEREQL